MSELRLLVDHEKLNYEGLFNVTELYQLIDNFFREKGFDKREVMNEEHIRTEGKYIMIELMPWKKITDYINHIIRIEIKMFGIKDVEVEKDGHKIKLNKGRMNIIFDAYLETDYEHRWEQKPMFFFLRTIFDKFIYGIYTKEGAGELKATTYELKDVIKGFLNLYKY